MKISVVIPTYNEEEFIGSCLDHLMQQTRKPEEIIVVNNNSQDATVEIAAQYGVRIVHEREQGMIPARNRGFNEACGDIIVRTDADTRPQEHWIEQIEKNFNGSDIDALSGPFTYYDLPGKHDIVFCNIVMQVMKQCSGTALMAGPNFALKRSVWLQARECICMDDSLVHEDIDLALSIHKVGGKVHWDTKLVMPTSSRRIHKKPFSFFGEYPVRFAKTYALNLRRGRN